MSDETNERMLTIEHGDSLEILREMPDESVDSIVTDPPAGIDFMGKGWDSDKGGRDNWIAWLREIMVEGLRVLKPGGHALVWAIPRTSHWTATAVEDAGFEIRDVVNHLFGTGFPKSLDVSKAIQKRREDDVRPVCRFLRAKMDELEVSSKEIAEEFGFHSRMVDHWAARETDSQPTVPTWEQWLQLKNLLEFGDVMDAEVRRLNERKGEAGEAWKDATVVGEHEGEPGGFGEHRFSVADKTIREPSEEAAAWTGWGTALKPAAEHWILARKPLCGTVAANVLKHGTGGLNVDGCRIGVEERALRKNGGERPADDASSYDLGSRVAAGTTTGRWPANVVLDEEAAEALDEQSGTLKTHPGKGARGAMGYGGSEQTTFEAIASEGGASRFFYVAKPSTAERDEGLEAFATKSGGEATGRKDGTDGLKSPRAGAGRNGNRKNVHPTVKSVALMRWLCRLITPPGGLVLDPFAGSGSTGCACAVEGFDFVGIEREAEYVEIARARLARWLEKAEKGEA